MPSKYWDEARARREQTFRFDFPERTLAGKTVIVAGGSGGLGAATSILLAREGARLIVGYRSNQSRARELQRQIQSEFPDAIAPVLIEGDLGNPQVRTRYFEAIAGAPEAFAGAAIFPATQLGCRWQNSIANPWRRRSKRTSPRLCSSPGMPARF